MFLLLALILVTQPVAGQSAEPTEVIQQHALPLENSEALDPLLDATDGRRLVLLGEASHGTSEYYTWRADISRRLIEEKGFRYVAVEGDWPQFSRINAFVKHLPGAPSSLDEAMDALDRWPLWMWRNAEFREFVGWLHEYNRDRPLSDRAGLYGVDLYAKRKAMNDVLGWLRETHPESVRDADRAYRCLTRYRDIRQYLQMVASTGQHCGEDMELAHRLVSDKQPDTADITSDTSFLANWGQFNAVQNARLAINAEQHFRGNLMQGPQSWNARASHFQTTVEKIIDFYARFGDDPEDIRGIVWAHNTHIGDARATDMGRHGMVNIGQLARERLGPNSVFSVGFSTYEGTVLAAYQWEGRMETMNVARAISGSWERLLAEARPDPVFMLDFSNEDLKQAGGTAIPHRAIGVTFDPSRANQNNYPSSIPSSRYDAFIFIRETQALEALDR